jgi:hypothetical protein
MNKDQLKKLEADLWSAADKLRADSEFANNVAIGDHVEVGNTIFMGGL